MVVQGQKWVEKPCFKYWNRPGLANMSIASTLDWQDCWRKQFPNKIPKST